MRLYIRTCFNLEILSRSKQKKLFKCIVEPALWSQVVFFSDDDMARLVKRVEETFGAVVCKEREVHRPDGYERGRVPVMTMRINEISDLANLDSIKAQDLKLMKYQ